MKSEVEVNYLFVSYVQQSIKNSASACLKKKQKYSHTYFPTDSLEDIMRSSISESYLSLDFISESEIMNLENFAENEALSRAIEQLNFKEKNYFMKNIFNVKQIVKLPEFLISAVKESLYSEKIIKKT